jgi:RNA polymerase sigma factor (TIGR02999 family)
MVLRGLPGEQGGSKADIAKRGDCLYGVCTQFPMSDVTLILQAAGRGDDRAMEDLLPVVYKELRNLAASRMAQEAAGHTLQPTALVHEAWLRLVSDEDRTWQNRAYFFGAAAEAMRRILIEHARRKSRLKRGGGKERLNIEGMELAATTPDDKILLVNDALERLENEHPERARVVVLKFFGGMTNKEVAETLRIGERTVDRHWVCAKTWLFRKVSESLDEDA